MWACGRTPPKLIRVPGQASLKVNIWTAPSKMEGVNEISGDNFIAEAKTVRPEHRWQEHQDHVAKAEAGKGWRSKGWGREEGTAPTQGFAKVL